jgi:hypothetical protein
LKYGGSSKSTISEPGFNDASPLLLKREVKSVAAAYNQWILSKSNAGPAQNDASGTQQYILHPDGAERRK